MAYTAVINRKLGFKSRRGDTIHLYPSAVPQVIPEAVYTSPYFAACMASGWVLDFKGVDAGDDEDTADIIAAGEEAAGAEDVQERDPEAESVYQAEAEEERLAAAIASQYAQTPKAAGQKRRRKN